MPFKEMTRTPSNLDEPPALPVREVPTAPGAAPRAAVNETEAAAVTRVYGDKGRTSRVPVALPGSGFRIAESFELGGAVRPQGILATRERVLVIALDRVVLYSATGEELATALRGGGDPLLDPERGAALVQTPRNDLDALSLEDGSRMYTIQGIFGHAYTRTYVAWLGSRLIMTGQKRLLPIERPDARRPVPQAVVQMDEFPDAPNVQQGYLTAVSTRSVLRETESLTLAAAGESVVIATDNRLYHLEPSLDVVSVVEGGFTALAMSLDELRRAYLVVSTPEGAELWVLSLEGERLLRVPVPAPPPGGYTPPIVGYDHAVMLPVERRIMILDPRGEHVADCPVSDRFAGAVTTADDRLVVADGSELVAYDREGNARVVASFGEAVLRTPPALLAGGTAWVATDRHLHRLEPAGDE